MDPVRLWSGIGARLLIPVVPALVMATPAFSAPFTVDPPGLADTAEPGSVLVWPKFVQGTVAVDAGTPGAATEDKTTIELGAVCPANEVNAIGGCLIPDNTPVRVRLHWVCPGATVGASPNICQETDFDVVVTLNGKATFNPSQNVGTGDNTVVPSAPCPQGYLIGWAVSNSEVPIAFNGLIGDSVQRNTATDLQSESALAIQADPTLASFAPVTVGPAPGGLGYTLIFDGNPGDYAMVTGQFEGDVRYTDDINPPFNDGSLILLTLDVASNLTNDQTEVALDFYNEKEVLTSTAADFICYAQYQLTAIDPNLDVENQGTRKGIVVSGQAIDADTGANRTLLAFFQDTEGPAAGVVNQTRSYTIRPSNNSVPIATRFVAF